VKNRATVEAPSKTLWVKSPIPQETAAAGRISCDLGFPFGAICASGWWVIGVGGRGGETTGRSSEGSVTAGAGGDHRSGPSAGAAGREIDWGFLDRRFASVCTPGPGQPGLPTRLVAGLFILKHMHNLSDEVLCARWLENPYYQFFCGELSFCHRLPFDRSSLTHWRQRLGEEQLVALIQESLSVAHKTGALATRDLERVPSAHLNPQAWTTCPRQVCSRAQGSNDSTTLTNEYGSVIRADCRYFPEAIYLESYRTKQCIMKGNIASPVWTEGLI
jgi:transposase-like protein DUF772